MFPVMIEKIRQLFASHFGTTNTPVIARSPGRINIIGEHTDYNNGYVLPAAINKAAYIALSFSDDDRINMVAHDMGETFAVNMQNIQPAAAGSWPNYLLGVIDQFQKRGLLPKGLNIILTSDVPSGAGLSSSAAIECAVAFALNELLQTKLDRITLIKMAQAAEHDYAGVLCGIMDQFASVMGKQNHLIKLDCASLDYEYVPFEAPGMQVLLLNTNIKHSLAASAYNNRRRECETGLAKLREQYPAVNSLRDVTPEMTVTALLPLNETVYHRCRFVTEEISRLLSACDDLRKGDIASLGKKMFATHDGLSKLYEVSCPELDFLVDFVRHRPEVIGARMMGGGFGGCTINLVQENKVEELLHAIRPAYEKTTGLSLTHYTVSIENGTELY